MFYRDLPSNTGQLALVRFRRLLDSGMVHIMFTEHDHAELVEPKHYISREVLDWLQENVGPAQERRAAHFSEGELWTYIKLYVSSAKSGDDARHFFHFFFKHPADAVRFKLTWA